MTAILHLNFENITKDKKRNTNALGVQCFRSNMVGTRFTCYDGGQNPKKGGVLSDGSNLREEMCAIIYVSKYFFVQVPH